MVNNSLGPVVVEFLELKASGRLAPAYAVAGRNGQVEFCGSEDVGTLTVVAPGGSALLVLGIGTRERTVEIYEAVNALGLFWDVKPNRVVLGGVERTFRPLGGQLVIGSLDSGDLTVILCQVGGRVGLVSYEGGVTTPLFFGAHADALGVVDLDAHRLLTPRPRTSRPLVPPVAPCLPCDAELSQMIATALRDLADRSASFELIGAGRRGKRAVGAFSEIMIALCGLGCGDLAGTSTDLCCKINAYFPGRNVVSRLKLSQVLQLILRTGTCILERPAFRLWLIRLGELRRPGSQLLKQFIAECPPSSALSLASSPQFEGVVVRPRANGALDQLREKLAAVVRLSPPKE